MNTLARLLERVGRRAWYVGLFVCLVTAPIGCSSPSTSPIRLLQAGATGYLIKQTAAADLLRAIREVHAGHRRIPAAVSARLAESWARAHSRPMLSVCPIQSPRACLPQRACQ